MKPGYFNPTSTCRCGCGVQILLTDREGPQFKDDPQRRQVGVPTFGLIEEAMDISNRVEEEQDANRTSSRRDLMIRALLEAVLTQHELLLRIAIHGIDGTGDKEDDQRRFNETLQTIHDYTRIAIKLERWVLDMDFGNAMTEIAVVEEEVAQTGFSPGMQSVGDA